jgi:hypothetical protein
VIWTPQPRNDFVLAPYWRPKADFVWIPGYGELNARVVPTFTNSGRLTMSHGRNNLSTITGGLTASGMNFASDTRLRIIESNTLEARYTTFMVVLNYYLTSNAGPTGSPNILALNSAGVMGIGSNGAAPNFKVFFTAAAATYQGTVDLQAGRPTVIIVRHRTGTDCDIVIDGRFEKFADIGRNYTERVSFIGGVQGASSCSSGIAQIVIWNRGLPDHDIQMLCGDPMRVWESSEFIFSGGFHSRYYYDMAA